MAHALVTGSNRGIGLALVRNLLARGDRVTAVCRHSSRELGNSGAQVESGVDVTDEGAFADVDTQEDYERLIRPTLRRVPEGPV